jgi:hypothetical protein
MALAVGVAVTLGGESAVWVAVTVCVALSDCSESASLEQPASITAAMMTTVAA